MKTTIITLILTFILFLTSCKKEEIITEDYIIATLYYRLVMIDKDSSINYSNVVASKAEVLSISGMRSGYNSTLDTDPDEEAKDFCKRNPNHMKCKPLPVVLEYFKIDYIGTKYIRLKWKSTDESNFSKYLLERSRDAKTYKVLSEIKPKGPSEYTYIDQTLK